MLKKTEDHHAGKLSPKLICKVKSFVDYIFFAVSAVCLCFSFFSAHPLDAFYFIMILHVYFIKTNDLT